MSKTTVTSRLIASTNLPVVGRSGTVNLTLTNGVLAVVARSGTVNVGVT